MDGLVHQFRLGEVFHVAHVVQRQGVVVPVAWTCLFVGVVNRANVVGRQRPLRRTARDVVAGWQYAFEKGSQIIEERFAGNVRTGWG